MIRYILRFLACFLVLTSVYTAASSEVPEFCAKIYKKGGAEPGADDCGIKAARSVSWTQMGSMSCRRSEHIDNYCGLHEECLDNQVLDQNNGECEERVDPEDNACSYGLPDFDTGICPPRPVLETYVPSEPKDTIQSSSNCGDPADLIPKVVSIFFRTFDLAAVSVRRCYATAQRCS